MIKNYLKSYGYLLGIIIILTLILSVINYFVKIPVTTTKIIILIISMFISSLMLGKNTKERAYLEGIKFSSIYIVFTVILKLILKSSFNYKVIIIYVTLLFTSVLGSMIGINSKRG